MVIDDFHGQWLTLSNFAPIPVEYGGKTWATSEAAFQAAKTEDETEKQMILDATTPKEAKKLGRKVSLRSDWDQTKDQIMYDIVYAKFTQNQDAAAVLKSTGAAELVEGNTWHDNYWGECRCEKCKNRDGKNTLGKILMKVREEI